MKPDKTIRSWHRAVWLLGACLFGSAPLAATTSEQLPTQAVVRLEVVTVTPDNGRLRKQLVTGSGVIIDPEGLILTNCHVVRQPVRATVWLADGRKRRAGLVGYDAPTDLAVLRIAMESGDERFPAAQFATGEAPVIGTPVWAVGSPGNLSQAVTAGVVANPALTLPDERTLPLIDGERVGRLVKWIAHDAPIFPGNSGGPLMNAAGQVVGINEISVAGLGGAIPAKLAERVAHELIAQGRVTRAWLGIEWSPAAVDDPGVRVATVWPGGPADQAGIKPGENIIRLGGQTVAATTFDALTSVAQMEEALAVGQPIETAVWRAGGERVLRIRPEIRPMAKSTPVELDAWGAVVRGITPVFAWENDLLGADGVWIESVRPGGCLGQARPAIRRGDRITAVAGQRVRTLNDLEDIRRGLGEEYTIGFERSRGDWLALVTGHTPGVPSTSARRGWVGLEVQVAERPLANKLGVPGRAVLRVTEIWPGSSAAQAGVQAGDVILAVDGERPDVRRAEDAGVLAAMMRACRPGGESVFTIWRDGAELKLPILVEARPVAATEVEKLEWPEIELVMRVATAEDRRIAGLVPDAPAVVVAQVESAGWAELAGLAAGDVVLSINGQPVQDLAQVAAMRAAAEKESVRSKISILVRRGRYRTVQAEIE